MISLSKLLSRTPTPEASTIGTAAPVNVELRQIPVVQVRVPPEGRIVFHLDPRSPGADRFRFIRMRLRELWSMGRLRSLLITSPLPGDGKSTVALNLATALAEGGKKSVLLMEADLHHPTLAETVDFPVEDGLAKCLVDGSDPIPMIRRLDPLQFYFLPAGRTDSNPTELLQSDQLELLMKKLAPLFDWIVIDAPPIVPLTDALTLSRYTDASLMVVRAARTPKDSLEQALSLIGPKHTLGIILNGAPGLNKEYSKYYGYYSKK